MKHIKYFVFCFYIINMVGCSVDNNEYDTLLKNSFNLDTLSFSHSEKGWELYTWQEGNSWKYSLLIGTNSLKNIEQVKSNPIVVSGEDLIKKVLEKLPKNEEIFWIGPKWLQSSWGNNFENLGLPPVNIIIDIKEFCQKCSLKLIDEEK